MKTAVTVTLPDLAALLARIAEAARQKRSARDDAPRSNEDGGPNP